MPHSLTLLNLYAPTGQYHQRFRTYIHTYEWVYKNLSPWKLIALETKQQRRQPSNTRKIHGNNSKNSRGNKDQAKHAFIFHLVEGGHIFPGMFNNELASTLLRGYVTPPSRLQAGSHTNSEDRQTEFQRTKTYGLSLASNFILSKLLTVLRLHFMLCFSKGKKETKL